MQVREIEWRYTPFADGWEHLVPDAVVWVEVELADLSWAQTDQYIVPGGANGLDKRYEKVGEWFASNAHCTMPSGNVSEDGFLLFTDGRHRFSWFRDNGSRALPIQVPAADAAEFERLLGSPIRISTVCIGDRLERPEADRLAYAPCSAS